MKKIESKGLGSKQEEELVNLAELLIQISLSQEKRIIELENLVNELKGEQGRPDISPKNQKSSEDSEAQGLKNYSSEKERSSNSRKRNKRKSKFVDVQADRVHIVDIKKQMTLPPDAVFQSYRTSWYYNFELSSELIAVKRKVYYSVQKDTYYVGDLPVEYAKGKDYTYNLQETVFRLKYQYGMSSPFILELLQESGVDISLGTINNILLEVGERLEEERNLIHTAGVTNSIYTATDTTLDRYNGANHHAHIFCNQWFTTYYTACSKDRCTTLDLLRGSRERIYLMNEHTIDLCQQLGSAKQVITLLERVTDDRVRNKVDFNAFLKRHLSDLSPKSFASAQKRVYEAAYLAAFHAEQSIILLSDNAPQYNLITLTAALCWIHAGRHLKKLNPVLKVHQLQLEEFLTQFWIYYDWLSEYKQNPTPEHKEQLLKDFDVIFSIKTNYFLLDERIERIKKLKNKLLTVLDYPKVPLQNNDAELAARRQVRYRDISFQTRSEKGKKAKNIALSIYQTCKKLGVDAAKYILDRLTQKMELVALAEVIRQRANPCV